MNINQLKAVQNNQITFNATKELIFCTFTSVCSETTTKIFVRATVRPLQ
jgi:hypothetical protein